MNAGRYWMICLLVGLIAVDQETTAEAMEIKLRQQPDKYLEVSNAKHAAKVCLLEGKIVAGDLDKIRRFIGTRTSAYKQEVRCDILYLNSPGGLFGESIEIMEYL